MSMECLVCDGAYWLTVPCLLLRSPWMHNSIVTDRRLRMWHSTMRREGVPWLCIHEARGSGRPYFHHTLKHRPTDHAM